MGIIALDSDVPPNLTNPMCIGTASLLAGANSGVGTDFGTTSQYPIPQERSVSWDDVQGWCPWDLQLSPPKKPGDGVYPYPDDSVRRPYFNPCYSACARYNTASDCCTGSYNSPTVCKPSLYSRQAKEVCPDAYSFGRTRDPVKSRRANDGWQLSTTKHQRSSSLRDPALKWFSAQRAGRRRYSAACQVNLMSWLATESARS